MSRRDRDEEFQRLEQHCKGLQNNLMSLDQEIMKSKKDLEFSEFARKKVEETKDSFLKELTQLKEKNKILTLAKVNEDLSLVVDADLIAKYKVEFEDQTKKLKAIPEELAQLQKTNNLLVGQLKDCKDLISKYHTKLN